MNGSIAGLFAAPNGGVPKPEVPMLLVHEKGCIGDKQNDLKHHGGPQRAVCLFSAEVLSELSSEGHPIYPGSVGENVLIQGIDWSLIQIGTQFHFKNVILEITSDAPPCRTIKASFSNDNFSRISVKKYPSSARWYAKVIQEGELFTNDKVTIN
tara:strand:- start:397 stop:858 length:462 start_codon:yes stop_codon:yes gene_type:complete